VIPESAGSMWNARKVQWGRRRRRLLLLRQQPWRHFPACRLYHSTEAPLGVCKQKSAQDTAKTHQDAFVSVNLSDHKLILSGDMMAKPRKNEK
jgi:hypothetical protein